MMNSLVYFVWIFLQLILCETFAKVGTACYGSPGIGCTEHTLRCTEPLVISITNITFGYRRGCSPASTCINTTCCREETGDCFTPYNQTLLSQLQQTCNGKSTCTLNSYQLNERSSRCFTGTPHAYSKIKYQCVINTPSATPQPTTEITSSTTTKIISKTISYNQDSTDLATIQETIAKVSTSCYGPQGLDCAEHRLFCTQPLIISIYNITFGYRNGCHRLGLANCAETTCCREKTGDCFTPYNQTLLSQLQHNCNGRFSCTLNRTGLNEKSSYCGFTSTAIFHSYGKIEYRCVTEKLSTPAPDSTPTDTDLGGKVDTNIGGIVGGIVGVILVIAIVGAVVFFFKRRLKKVKSQNEHQYYSPPSRIIDQPTPVHDLLNTRQQTDDGSQHIDEQQLSVTTNRHSRTNYPVQDYEHAYDSAPSGVTGGPRAVNDSLNTREQTGYYNMGNISANDDSQHSTTNNGRSPINTNNPDYENAYSVLDHDTNEPKNVYDSLNTREQTGYYNMGSINTTDDSQQTGRANDMAQT